VEELKRKWGKERNEGEKARENNRSMERKSKGKKKQDAAEERNISRRTEM
jgi:hypothetical protein